MSKATTRQPHQFQPGDVAIWWKRSHRSMITLNFLVTSLIVVLIPGTGVVYTISTGLTLGRRASIFAALGCTAGIIPHLLATVLGLSAVIHAPAVGVQGL